MASRSTIAAPSVADEPESLSSSPHSYLRLFQKSRDRPADVCGGVKTRPSWRSRSRARRRKRRGNAIGGACPVTHRKLGQGPDLARSARLAQRDAEAYARALSRRARELKLAVQSLDPLPHADDAVVMRVLGVVDAPGRTPALVFDLDPQPLAVEPKHAPTGCGARRAGWRSAAPRESASAGCPRCRCRARPASPRSARGCRCPPRGRSGAPIGRPPAPAGRRSESPGAGSTPPVSLRRRPRGLRTSRGRAIRRSDSARSPGHATPPRAASTRRRTPESTCRAFPARAGCARRARRRTAGGCCAHGAGNLPTRRGERQHTEREEPPGAVEVRPQADGHDRLGRVLRLVHLVRGDVKAVVSPAECWCSRRHGAGRRASSRVRTPPSST